MGRSEMSPPKLTLVYFNNNVRARTECARMILAYGAVPHTFADCQTYFGCSFPEAKKNGKLPFGQLPILAVDDKVIAQSGAIDRFAASQVKTPGFVPADPVTKALCDMVYDTHHDLFKIMPLVNLWSGEKWQQEKDEFFQQHFPRPPARPRQDARRETIFLRKLRHLRGLCYVQHHGAGEAGGARGSQEPDQYPGLDGKN